MYRGVMVFESCRWPDKASSSSTANIEHIRAAYQACKFKLFAQEEEFVRLQIVTIKPEAVGVDLVESTDELLDYMTQAERAQDVKATVCKSQDTKNEKTEKQVARLYIIDPLDGWNRLEMTEVGMTFLLQTLGVFPQFFRHLSTFGIKDFPRDEGFAGYDVDLKYGLDASLSSVETCFTWKYVERKEKEEETRCPFSIRHAVVYQAHDFMTKKSENIIIRPSSATFATLQQSLRVDADQRTDFIEQWTSIPMICVESGTSCWRDFINFLDEEISKMSDNLFLVCINDGKSQNGDFVDDPLATMKRLQYLTDQIMRTCHMLDLNQATVERMVKSVNRILSCSPEKGGQGSEIEDRMESVVHEYSFLKKAAQAIYDRALQDTIALRNHETNKKAAEATNQGTRAIAELARKSAHEARVVKILTIVAIIFVPASFAAVWFTVSKDLSVATDRLKDFMQMGYLSVNQLVPFTIIGKADLWLWAILAFPLIFVTLIIYAACEVLSRRAARVQLRRDDENEKGIV